MSIDAHVASSSSETFVVLEGDVFASVRIYVFLSQTKVDHIDYAMSIVGLSTDEEVLRFHVSVDQMVRVDILYSLKLF